MRASEHNPRPWLERLWGLVLLPLLVLDGGWLTTPLLSETGIESDGLYYAAMAGDPRIEAAMAHQAPWCWRVLTPLIVRHLPWETLTSFQVVDFAANWISLGLLYATLRRSGLRTGVATAGVLLYAADFWAIRFSFYAPSYTDSVTQVFIIGTIYCLVARAEGLLVAILTLGVFQKETELLLVPAAILSVFRSQRAPRVRWALAAATAVVPAAACIALRRAISPDNAYSVIPVFLWNLRMLLKPEVASVWCQSLISGLGILPLMLLCAPKETRKLLARNPEWLVAALFTSMTVLGGFDKSRSYLPTLPILTVVAAQAVWPASVQLSRSSVIWIAATVGVQAYIGNWLTPMGDVEHVMARMVPEHASGEQSLPYLVAFGFVALGWFAATLMMRRLASRVARAA